MTRTLHNVTLIIDEYTNSDIYNVMQEIKIITCHDIG